MALVTIVHPDRLEDGTARVSEEALEEQYAERGFVLYDPEKHRPKPADPKDTGIVSGVILDSAKAESAEPAADTTTAGRRRTTGS